MGSCLDSHDAAVLESQCWAAGVEDCYAEGKVPALHDEGAIGPLTCGQRAFTLWLYF